MKLSIIMCIMLFLSLLIGCDNTEDDKYKCPETEEIKIIYRKKGDDEITLPATYMIYEDDKYRYLMDYSAETYVEKNGEKFSYEEALEQKIIDIDDLLDIKDAIIKEEK